MTLSALCGALALALAACGGAEVPTGPAGPHVSGVEAQSVVVGQSLKFFGDGFLERTEGVTQLEFAGVYLWKDETGRQIPEEVVPFRVAGINDGEVEDGPFAKSTALRINRFGPFAIPFGADGRQIGTFKGTVKAVNVYDDGSKEEDSAPSEITIEVEPSIIVTMLEPVVGATPEGEAETPGCGSPALRVFGGLPYILEVEAVGFEPAYFMYEISAANGSDGWVSFTHPATGKVDRLGDPTWRRDEILVFDALPDSVEFNVAAIRVTAVDANDQSYFTGLPVPVVRPVAFHYDGNREVGEYYEPVAVHGPVVGAIGTELSYTESRSEERQQGVSIGIDRSFNRSHETTSSTNWTEGFSSSETTSTEHAEGIVHSEGQSSGETYGTTYDSSDSTSVSFSSSTGSDWGWNLSEETSESQLTQEAAELYGEVATSVNIVANGSASIPGVAEVGGSVGNTTGVTAGTRGTTTTGSTQGSSSGSGYHLTETESSDQAFGSVTTDGRSDSVSGSYALSSEQSISSHTSYADATSESVTYDFGGSEGLSENVSVGESESWGQTWSSTASSTSLLSYSSRVPRGRCAVVYRQTVRYVRTAHLYSYDLCGVRSPMGELQLNEWSWSPNIAIGDDCEKELPPSTLPAARCFVGCD